MSSRQSPRKIVTDTLAYLLLFHTDTMTDGRFDFIGLREHTT